VDKAVWGAFPGNSSEDHRTLRSSSGEVLLTIALEGEAAPKEEKPKAEERPKSVSVVGVLPDQEEEILATPAVRALAKDLGVNLESVKGSGPGGSITKEDVMKAAPQEKKAEDSTVP
jgi:pyruvate dehydrogenase E2 component (dihydrolipoamide acetyltransferase)